MHASEVTKKINGNIKTNHIKLQKYYRTYILINFIDQWLQLRHCNKKLLTYLKDSAEFLYKINRNHKIPPQLSTITSIDVSFLYTNIPHYAMENKMCYTIYKIIQIITHDWNNPQLVTELINLVLIIFEFII